MRRTLLAFAFTLSFTAISPVSAFAAQNPKISGDAANAPSTAIVPVIIQYNLDPGSVQDSSIRRHKGVVTSTMHSIGAKAAILPQTELDGLATDPAITYISLDRALGARSSVHPTCITAPEYTTEAVNAEHAWKRGHIGTGIGVAVIDSGVTPVADLGLAPTLAGTAARGQTRVIFSQSFVGVAPAAAKDAATTPDASAGLTSCPAAPPVPAGVDTNPVPRGTAMAPGLVPFPTEPTQIARAANGAAKFAPAAAPIPSGSRLAPPTDEYGHGTHVAGLIAGNGAQSTGNTMYRTFFGTAPDANIIDLRALDANGNGTDSSVIAAIDNAIYLKDIYNIRVINLSLGRPVWESYKLDPLCQAVEKAWQAGIAVVVSAGNQGRNQNLNGEGYGTIESPGNDPYVITVGAMNTNGTENTNDDTIASYSSKGPSFIDQVSKPDLVAPGNLVIGLQFAQNALVMKNPTLVTYNSFYRSSGRTVGGVSSDYFPLSGTSMAAGVVSGAVADLIQANPSLTPDQVKAILMQTADRTHMPHTSSVSNPDTGMVYNANYDAFTIGAGYLDLQAASRAVDNGMVVPSGSAMSPVASFDASSGNVTLVPDQTAIWGATAHWSATQVYGNGAFVHGSTAVWGTTPLWGANDPNGFTALWGAGTTTNSTAIWGAGTAIWGAGTAIWGANTHVGQPVFWSAGTPAAALALWSPSSAAGQGDVPGADPEVDYPY